MARYLLRRRRPRSRKLCAVISVVVGCAILALNLCWPYLLRWLTERCGRPGKFCASSTTTTATPNNPALGWDSAPDPGSIPLLVVIVGVPTPSKDGHHRAAWLYALLASVDHPVDVLLIIRQPCRCGRRDGDGEDAVRAALECAALLRYLGKPCCGSFKAPQSVAAASGGAVVGVVSIVCGLV